MLLVKRLAEGIVCHDADIAHLVNVSPIQESEGSCTRAPTGADHVDPPIN